MLTPLELSGAFNRKHTFLISQDCCVWAMGLLAVECTALTILRLTSCRQTEDLRRQSQGVKRILLLLPDGLKTLQLGAHISLNADIMKAIGEKRRYVKYYLHYYNMQSENHVTGKWIFADWQL